MSTDKAVRPTNMMGASKRLAEMALQVLAAAQRGAEGRTTFSMGSVTRSGREAQSI